MVKLGGKTAERGQYYGTGQGVACSVLRTQSAMILVELEVFGRDVWVIPDDGGI